MESHLQYDTEGKPVQLTEARAAATITNKILIGAESSLTTNLATGQQEGKAFIGAYAGSYKFGFGDIPKSNDVIAETSIGGYFGLGGEASLQANFSELGRR